MYLDDSSQPGSSFCYAVFAACVKKEPIREDLSQAVQFLQTRPFFHYDKCFVNSIRVSFSSKEEAILFKTYFGKSTLLSSDMTNNGIELPNEIWDKIATQWNAHKTEKMPSLVFAKQMGKQEGYTLEKPILTRCIML